MDANMKKRLTGACIGVIAALLLLHYGFLGTLFIIVMGALGWWIAAGHPVPDSIKSAIGDIGKNTGADQERASEASDAAPDTEDKE